MNQWLVGFLIFWLGTGALVVLHEWAVSYGKRGR